MSPNKPLPSQTYCSQSRRCCPDSRSPRRTGRPAVHTGPGRRTPTRSTCTATRAGWARTPSRQFRPRSHHLRHSARSSEHISCCRTETRSVHINCCRLELQKLKHLALLSIAPVFHLRQEDSSEPSEQSTSPSQMAALSIHSPLAQVAW